MPKIVVLGAGIGGISMAYALRTGGGRAAVVPVGDVQPVEVGERRGQRRGRQRSRGHGLRL